MTNTYDPGDGVTLLFTCRDEAGELGDPDDVYLDVRQHDALGPTTYTYGVDSEVVRTSEGTYSALLLPDEPGLWHYGWRGEGGINTAEQGSFLVRPWRPGSEEATS
jgi:hypothetical protein